MGEVDQQEEYSPSLSKRPSPSSVAEVLGIVQLQQQPFPRTPPPNQKGFNNPLPAIGRSSKPPTHRDDTTAGENGAKIMSKSLPSPRTPQREHFALGNGRNSRNENILPVQHKGISRKDSNHQLPPINSLPESNGGIPDLLRSKTTLTRTHSDGDTVPRPRSSSNPRPKSARGVRGSRARSFNGEEIQSQDSVTSSPPIRPSINTDRMNDNKLNTRNEVLLMQRRPGGMGSNSPRNGRISLSVDSNNPARRGIPSRPSNPSPLSDDYDDIPERPSAPSPPSPGLDSDSESDGEY